MDRGRQEKTVTLLTGFRQYLHYHLKATKTYMHMRMRKRVVGLLQGKSHSRLDSELESDLRSESKPELKAE